MDNRPSDTNAARDMAHEHTPLLSQSSRDFSTHDPNSPHRQFCILTGILPSDEQRSGKRYGNVGPHTLYGRVLQKRSSQQYTYLFTAALSNTMLLTQVVLGAALTALGASESSHVLITVFGAVNTVIAGMIAYLKSRGQPMRSRVYRDDLDRVIDEIENSEVMWLGIARGVHGYDEIAVEDAVSVRSEVARLTRLYNNAVRGNTMNDPDMYTGGVGAEVSNAALRARPVPQSAVPPPANLVAPAQALAPATEPALPSDDLGPAIAPPKPVDSTTPKEKPEKPQEEPAKPKEEHPAPTTEVTRPENPAPKPQPSKDETPKSDPDEAGSGKAKEMEEIPKDSPVERPAETPKTNGSATSAGASNSDANANATPRAGPQAGPDQRPATEP